MNHVVITGASRGLGRALAVDFASIGWKVSCCGTQESALQSLSDEMGTGHLVVKCDVTMELDVARFADRAFEQFGAPKLVLNNAALINRNAPLWEVTAEDFSRVVDVNLKGVHHIIRAFLPSMIRAETGVLVNFSSGWGRSVSPEVAPYCATKWGIEGLTKALASELPTGLAAIALNPGVINTDMLQSTFAEGATSYPSAQEWAKSAVPFLIALNASDNGKSLTAPVQ